MINQCREQHKIELTMGSASRSLCGLAQPVAYVHLNAKQRMKNLTLSIMAESTRT